MGLFDRFKKASKNIVKEYEEQNRKRLINLLSKIENRDFPYGWKLVANHSIGGLTEVGFSQTSNFF